jgi:hypothetical protein
VLSGRRRGERIGASDLAKEKPVAGPEAQGPVSRLAGVRLGDAVEPLTQRLHFDRQLATRLIHERALPSATIRSSDAGPWSDAWHRADVVSPSETRTRRVLGQ